MLSGPGVDKIFAQKHKVDPLLKLDGFTSQQRKLLESLAQECKGHDGQSALKRGEFLLLFLFLFLFLFFFFFFFLSFL